jgi:hypothetical protein
MASEFRELVDMWRIEANRTERLFEECNQMQAERDAANSALKAAIGEIVQLKHAVETALHGRVKESDNVSRSSTPNEYMAAANKVNELISRPKERISEREQVGPRCPTCGRA